MEKFLGFFLSFSAQRVHELAAHNGQTSSPGQNDLLSFLPAFSLDGSLMLFEL